MFSHHRPAPPGLQAQLSSTPHDGVALGHFARAQSEAGGDDCREALRDGGHGERDGDLEVVDAVVEGELDGAGVGHPGGALEGVPGQEVVVIDHPHQHADGKDDLRAATNADQHPEAHSHMQQQRHALQGLPHWRLADGPFKSANDPCNSCCQGCSRNLAWALETYSDL